MFKVIHILDAVESPPVSSSRMQCGQLYILTTPSNTTRLKVHGLQLISAISCPKAGWFITWSSKQRCLANRFLRNGDLPYFCNIACRSILLFSHTLTFNESSFVSNRYNYHDPKLHTMGIYQAVANGALLSLVSKSVAIDRSGQEVWHLVRTVEPIRSDLKKSTSHLASMHKGKNTEWKEWKAQHAKWWHGSFG